MEQNICKAKGCNTEIPSGDKYCSYHKNKRAEHRGTIIKTGLGLAGSVVLAVVTKGKFKPKA
ncbi:hypothetical protein AMHIJAGA_01254 [Lactococcus lactis]|uniref:Uncharacterized protein n=1 Tax=Lactococcus lactis TaxID=1358 RepID=A0A2X0SLD2_9LACT|nr:hypothetical protein AMHIJAGA_01254 [Lactococcus lactis]